jgi:hypothetical protein
MIIRSDQSSHWYTRDGRPAYETEYATKPGQYRKTTLADARKLGLVPSVTTVLQIMAKPGLQRWKDEQLIMATATTPRTPDMTDQQWVNAVLDAADEASLHARTRGTNVHAAVEIWHDSQAMPDDPELRELVETYADWFSRSELDVNAMEVPFANCDIGYGGKIDMICTIYGHRAIVDLKTQSTREGQKIKPYMEYGMQLAAYRNGIGPAPDDRLYNIIVSTTEPGRIEVYDWTDRAVHMWTAFVSALDLWERMNNYSAAEWQSTKEHDSGKHQ